MCVDKSHDSSIVIKRSIFRRQLLLAIYEIEKDYLSLFRFFALSFFFGIENMINPHRVGQLLIDLISKQLPSQTYNPVHDARDEDVATVLYNHIESIVGSTHYSFETDYTIDFVDNVNRHRPEPEDEEDGDPESEESTMEVEEEEAEVEEKEDEDDDESEDESEDEGEDEDNYYSQSDESGMEVQEEDGDDAEWKGSIVEMEEEEEEGKNKLVHLFSIEYMKNVIDFYDDRDAKTGRKKHTWNSLQHRFPKVKNRNYIQRFRKYLDNGGTKLQKLKEIDRFTYERVVNARSQFLMIHDIHLKRWALIKAKQLNDNTFTASVNWINCFKKRHSLCSRKVTKLTTQHEVTGSDVIHKSSDDYVKKIRKILPQYDRRNILNTDQSGLELEMVGNRTLSFRGEKTTLAKVRSLYNTSHSYTVQFIVSLSGQFIGSRYLCLKELNGRMSDGIKNRLFHASNVTVTCSKSGKLTTYLVQYWIQEVLEPTVGNEKVLLLSDSWGAQTDPQLYASMEHLRIETIPKKTTAMIQPLDITINRQYKHIVRTIFDHVRLYNIDCNISQRNNIIKLTSLSYNQLCSIKFAPMIRYSWFRAGYLTQDPGPFQTVDQVCFQFQPYHCDRNQCNNISLIQCSFCEDVLCFYRFFVVYHIH